MTWEWLLKRTIIALHAGSIAEHGGGPGVRDEGLLESALARAQDLAAYGTPTPFDLAAAYAFGIVRNHPFVDGNKRSGLLAAYTFLRRNGRKLGASEVEAVTGFLKLASGDLAEAELASWFERNSQPIK
ncbi:MAG: type II toxin-antitoxin system death-on-curing family toxin [Alphaproteobacteria bacterium]|nr:type II toxin-antitoxin system death-on-curing family toxin [Alphaproteobacteria bacterium]